MVGYEGMMRIEIAWIEGKYVDCQHTFEYTTNKNTADSIEHKSNIHMEYGMIRNGWELNKSVC